MSKDEQVIGPYFRSPAACHDYDPRTPAVARRIASMITSRFPALTVEHVGSTSVPGCSGKGVIDLMVVYPPGLLEDAKMVLADLGFQRQISPDPHPEDRPMRTGSVQYQESTFRVHIHVLTMDSPEVEQLRTFRDRLRTDPNLVDAYVARKQEIIVTGITDTAEYARAKGPFVEKVLTDEAK
jgi:GrpB-like predicted nucleotidyltransferase (UPF0157 family)